MATPVTVTLTGLAAYPQAGFIDKTYQYFMENTGIPVNFGISVALGFIVGTAFKHGPRSHASLPSTMTTSPRRPAASSASTPPARLSPT